MAEQEELDEIRKQRETLYGDPHHTFDVYGKMVTAIIEAHYGIKLPHDLPGHVAAQLDVGKKALRAVASTRYNEDDYVDEQNYVRLAQMLDTRKAINVESPD